MSTTAMDKPSSDLQRSSDSEAEPNRAHIRKAFNLLKAHASAVATFALQWQDLEDHLQSINNSIQSKLHHLQNPSPAKAATKPSSDTVNGIPIGGGGGELARYLRERVKDHEALRHGLRGALAASERAAELVLEAVAVFFTAEPGEELGAARKSCLLLLEEFAKAGLEIGAGARVEAVRVVHEWKSKLNLKMVNSQDGLGFLMFLSAFKLVGEFDRDEVLGLIDNVAQRKQAPDLFRFLGFSDTASDFIQNLISQKKWVEAVRFSHEFELADKFPSVPLLQNHVNDVEKIVKTLLKNGKSSPKDKAEAVNKEMAALRAAVRCIEEYKLESDFSPEGLKKRIASLKNQKKAKKAKERMAKPKAPVANSQPQMSGNKRSFPDSKTELRIYQNGNKHPRIAPEVATMPNVYARAPAAVHLVHQRPLRADSDGMEYFIPSTTMLIQSAASPNVPARAAPTHAMHHEGLEYSRGSASEAAMAHALHHHRTYGMPELQGTEYSRASAPNTSDLYTVEAHHYQPSGPSTSQQRAQYSPTRYYTRSTLDTHGLAVSPTQRMSLASGAYGLTSSIPETQRMSTAQFGLSCSSVTAERINVLDEKYGMSAARILQRSGVPSNASPHAYYPEDALRVAGHSERPLPSSSDYELLSKRSVFHL